MIELVPGWTEHILAAEHGAGRIALEFLALGVLQVELDAARQSQQFAYLLEAELALEFERMGQGVALSQ